MATTLTTDFKRVLEIFVSDITEGRLNTNPFQPELTSLDFGLYEDGRFRYFNENDETVFEKLTASIDHNDNKIIKTDKMIITDLPLLKLSLITKDDIDLEAALFLIDSYDHYTGAIDDGAQYRQANDNNKTILSKLFDMGVYSITFKDLALMFSNPKDITFNLFR